MEPPSCVFDRQSIGRDGRIVAATSANALDHGYGETFDACHDQ